jgi:hypothetical protein
MCSLIDDSNYYFAKKVDELIENDYNISFENNLIENKKFDFQNINTEEKQVPKEVIFTNGNNKFNNESNLKIENESNFIIKNSEKIVNKSETNITFLNNDFNEVNDEMNEIILNDEMNEIILNDDVNEIKNEINVNTGSNSTIVTPLKSNPKKRTGTFINNLFKKDFENHSPIFNDNDDNGLKDIKFDDTPKKKRTFTLFKKN